MWVPPLGEGVLVGLWCLVASVPGDLRAWDLWCLGSLDIREAAMRKPTSLASGSCPTVHCLFPSGLCLPHPGPNKLRLICPPRHPVCP